MTDIVLLQNRVITIVVTGINNFKYPTSRSVAYISRTWEEKKELKQNDKQCTNTMAS